MLFCILVCFKEEGKEMNEVIEIKLRNCRTNEKNVITAYSCNHAKSIIKNCIGNSSNIWRVIVSNEIEDIICELRNEFMLAKKNSYLGINV